MDKEEKLSVSGRNGRYLLVFSFISVVLVVLNKSINMLENQLNKIYIYQSNIPYIKMVQAFPAIIFVVCIFLLVVLIRYSYFEANAFVERDTNSQQIFLQKANDLYDNIFYYLKIFGIGILLYLLFGIITDRIAIAKKNYAVAYTVVVVLSAIGSIVAVRKTSKKKDVVIPCISNVVIGAAVFLLFCLSAITIFLPQQTIANLRIEYDSQYINMNFEGNLIFEQIQIIVNNEMVENINGKTENYFISKYISKESETDIFVEEDNDYFYYTKIVDINDYVDEGTNEVKIFFEIRGRNYTFSNPLVISNSKYEYVKLNYETPINIKE